MILKNLYNVVWLQKYPLYLVCSCFPYRVFLYSLTIDKLCVSRWCGWWRHCFCSLFQKKRNVRLIQWKVQCLWPIPHYRTEEDFRKYVHEVFIPKAPIEELENLWTLYPSTPSAGSPFGTGNITYFSRQFKRMAAFQGDVVFQAPTRFFLQSLSGRQKIWSFCKSFKYKHGGRLRNLYIQYPNGWNTYPLLARYDSLLILKLRHTHLIL